MKMKIPKDSKEKRTGSYPSENDRNWCSFTRMVWWVMAYAYWWMYSSRR